jgi:hypothetical protein
VNSFPLYPRQFVHAPARRAYARLLREFARGALTNDQYENRCIPLCAMDTAVDAIHNQFVWLLYDDLYPHRLKGKHALSREARRHLARAILLLRSEHPADAWEQRVDGSKRVAKLGLLALSIPIWPIVALVAWAWHAARLLTRSQSPESAPPNDAWPFLSHSDFETARQSPTFLAGV